jgi:hypothetical protein
MNNAITINGKQFDLKNNNSFSGLPVVLMAKSFQDWNGVKIVYDGISRDDAKALAESGGEALDGILCGISAIAELLAFVNFDDAGTDNISSIAWLISGLAELGQSAKRETDLLNLYHTNKSA